MKRILLLDRGNRFLKAAVARSGEVGRGSSMAPEMIGALLAETIEEGDLDGVAFSSVVPDWSVMLRRLLEESGVGTVVEVRYDMALPFEIGVDSPETLGPDRISAAAGAWASGGREAVIVDAGTAVTVDVVHNGVFEGGAIFPGSHLLARSLSDGTAALPFIAGTSRGAALPGRNTEAAIRAGITWGLVGAVTELVRRSSPPGASIWLTGGECDLYAAAFEGELHVDEDLVLEGLLDLYRRNAG
jgi:type III pantothenate kinase